MLRSAFIVLHLALTHLRDEIRRNSYLVIAIAVTVSTWMGLSALASPFVRADVPLAGKVTVVNARKGGTLPVRYAAKIARMPGVSQVSYLNFSPVICKSPSTTATLNGLGGGGVHKRLVEIGVDAMDEKQWNADPLGILVGVDLAAACGWRAGMSVAPPDIHGRPVQIHIDGVFHSDQPYNNQVAYAHYAYINRLSGLMGQRDHVNSINLQSGGGTRTAELVARIDAEFANDDPPVNARAYAATESALARFGKVQDLLAWVMVAILACTMLVLVSALAHAAAQRRSTVAVLQVLGFQRGTMLSAFCVEYCLVMVAAVAIGVCAGELVVHLLAPSLGTVLGRFVVPAWAYVYLPVWIFVLGIVSLVLPSMIIFSTRPVDYAMT